MIPAASRPLTQQGMTGLQSAQGLASGASRQIRDKRYYMSAIRGHMNSINDEINRLVQRLSEYKLEAANFEECKKQHDILEEDLKKYQEKLTIYNMTIETSMMKGTKSDIDVEIEHLRRLNHMREEELEILYAEILAKKDELKKMEDIIEEETSNYNDAINNLPDDIRAEYFRLNEENKHLQDDEKAIKNEISVLTSEIKTLEPRAFESEAKRSRYELLLRAMEIKSRSAKLAEEDKLKGNPKEERIYLLEQVKKNRDDIELFKSQEEELKNEISSSKDRLTELDDELSENNSARLNKFRELLKRQETMDSFLADYDTTHKSLYEKIQECKSNIDFSLEYISENSVLLNMEDSHKKFDSHVLNTNSVNDLIKEMQKSKNSLNMLNSLKDKFKKDLDLAIAEEKELKLNLEQFKDIQTAQNNLLENINSQETQKESLKNLLRTTQLAVNEAKVQRNNTEMELKGNKSYEEVTKLEAQLEELTEEINQLNSLANENSETGHIQKFEQDCFKLVHQIHDLLKK